MRILGLRGGVSCCLCLSLFAFLAAEAATRRRQNSPIQIDFYAYEPSLLPLPPDATVEHAHGLAILNDGTILLTYKDVNDTSKCLLRWKPDSYDQPATFLGPGKALCDGVPHGLKSVTEYDGITYLYHANNNRALHKTTLEGEIVWSVHGKPIPNDAADFKPTWFASADAGSPVVYMADGYGSSRIYLYNRTSGAYMNRWFGGNGTKHGQFQTNHALQWDEERELMVVADRANHRLEYFNIVNGDDTLEYNHTLSLMPDIQLPCNIRFKKRDNDMEESLVNAIVPSLEGTVGLLDKHNQLQTVLNISDRLGHLGFLHPHDAHFLPHQSNDFVLATWNPGRIGYFRRVPINERQQEQSRTKTDSRFLRRA